MHRTTLTRAQRTRGTSAGNHRTRALKNGLPWNWTSRRGPHRPGCGSAGLCHGSNRTRRRSLIHRTRASLRNNHARRRRRNWHSRTGRSYWSLRCGRSCGGRRCRSRRRNHSDCWRRHRTRRSHKRRRCGGYCWSRRRGHGSSGLLHHGSDNFRPRRRRGRFRRWNRWRHGRRRRSCHWRRRHNHWSGGHGRRCGTSGRRNRFLLLGNGFQYISRPGDVRQVNLGLDFFFAAQRARRPGRQSLRFGRAADVGPHLLCFVLLERTGMGLLLRHSDDR